MTTYTLWHSEAQQSIKERKTADNNKNNNKNNNNNDMNFYGNKITQ